MAEITVVGGINIDIEGIPYQPLRTADSNPGIVNQSFGGVGRNIVENIARMGGDAAMLSLTGDDFMGESARKQLESLGVDTDHIYHIQGESTGVYLSILNHRNDMELAICNMDILERITPAFLEDKMEFLNRSKIVGVDCNLQRESLDYITERARVPLFLDPVSASKAERVKPIIGAFHTIKPNRIEAELLSGIKITDEISLSRAGEWFCRQGVKRVFISLGEKGAYYREGACEGIAATKSVRVLSATGAGDAFSAAILLGHVKGMSAREAAQMGIACASIAMEAKTAVNPEISMEKVYDRI
ncbi:carbohydrate kinase family protein [Emergencia sp. 1XD21-10]|uniref:carbohydrate kinase family protein n=1 Tax=Emergencia sp. 1XD21-10 TaxID=2304569 RepID=UPI00137AEAD8|nr:carbohydrate kinase family protein [Emergencia sp. 1XD21-10]NCE98727.1 hypothetical protein [Emergencia sp. 1XD21-10]